MYPLFIKEQNSSMFEVWTFTPKPKGTSNIVATFTSKSAPGEEIDKAQTQGYICFVEMVMFNSAQCKH